MHKHFILHELKKTNKSRDTLFVCSRQEVQADSNSVSLISELHAAISNSNRKAYGIFSKAGISYFRQEFDNYLEREEYDLLQSSKAFIGDDNYQSLKMYLSAENLSTGGHVLIIDYEVDEKRYFVVSMISNKIGRAVNIHDGIPRLMNTEQLDFKDLDLACRIDVDKYRSGQKDQNYLCFISGSGGVSKYFINFVGCENFNQSKDNSRKLIGIINGLAEGISDGGEIKRRAYEYCESRLSSRSPVDLYDMASYVFGEMEKTRIVDYANANDISVDHVFSPNRQEVRRLINFKFKGDWIESFCFDRSFIRENIYINSEANEVVLKNVSSLIAELKDENR